MWPLSRIISEVETTSEVRGASVPRVKSQNPECFNVAQIHFLGDLEESKEPTKVFPSSSPGRTIIISAPVERTLQQRCTFQKWSDWVTLAAVRRGASWQPDNQRAVCIC